jgi:hypothetical protein
MKSKFELSCYYEDESKSTKVVLANHSTLSRSATVRLDGEVVLFVIRGRKLDLGECYAPMFCEFLAARLDQLAGQWQDTDFDKNIAIHEQPSTSNAEADFLAAIAEKGGSVRLPLKSISCELTRPKWRKSYVVVLAKQKVPRARDRDSLVLSAFDSALGVPACLRNVSVALRAAAQVWVARVEKTKMLGKAPVQEFAGSILRQTTYTKAAGRYKFSILHTEFEGGHFIFWGPQKNLKSGYVLTDKEYGYDAGYSSGCDESCSADGLKHVAKLSAEDQDFMNMFVRNYGDRDHDECEDLRGEMDFPRLAKKLGWASAMVQSIDDVSRIAYSYD